MRVFHGDNPKARTKLKELEVYGWLREAGLPFDYQAHVPFRGCGLESETRCAFVDFLMYTHWGAIVLEVDEDQHRHQDPSCDVRRDFDIAASVALGSGHDLVIVRFNPSLKLRKELLDLLDDLLSKRPKQPFQRIFLGYDSDEVLPRVAKDWDAAAKLVSRVHSPKPSRKNLWEGKRDSNSMVHTFQARGAPKNGIQYFSVEPAIDFNVHGEIVWPASVFRGTGKEPRVNLSLRLPPPAVETVRNLEKELESLGSVHSCLKEDVAKTKVNLEGEKVRVWDSAAKPVDPEILRTMRNQPVSAIVNVKGAYKSSQGCGLMLETEHLKLWEKQEECPFA
jgi:hypothetical protein